MLTIESVHPTEDNRYFSVLRSDSSVAAHPFRQRRKVPHNLVQLPNELLAALLLKAACHLACSVWKRCGLELMQMCSTVTKSNTSHSNSLNISDVTLPFHHNEQVKWDPV